MADTTVIDIPFDPNVKPEDDEEEATLPAEKEWTKEHLVSTKSARGPALFNGFFLVRSSRPAQRSFDEALGCQDKMEQLCTELESSHSAHDCQAQAAIAVMSCMEGTASGCGVTDPA